MTITQIKKEISTHLLRQRVFQFRRVTLFLLGIVLLSGIIIAAWFAGENRISQIFGEINSLQENPPMWIEAPMVMGKYLLAPTVVLF